MSASNTPPTPYIWVHVGRYRAVKGEKADFLGNAFRINLNEIEELTAESINDDLLKYLTGSNSPNDALRGKDRSQLDTFARLTNNGMPEECVTVAKQLREIPVNNEYGGRYIVVLALLETESVENMSIIDAVKHITRIPQLSPGSSYRQIDPIPLKDRNFEKDIKVIIENMSHIRKNDAKTTIKFITCTGAPGIGKTRYGVELFAEIEKSADLKLAWKTGEKEPRFIYLHLDFASNHELGIHDSDLPMEQRLSFRLAHAYFTRGHSLSVFDTFISNGRNCKSMQLIADVLEAIREYEKLAKGQKLFLFLHIDEIQKIFSYEEPNTPTTTRSNAGFFRELMVLGGKCMSPDGCTYMNMFFSGTSSIEVVEAKKASEYSFHPVACTLLSLQSCVSIVHELWGPRGRKVTQLKPVVWLLQDTIGLPRAMDIVNEVLKPIFNNKNNKDNKDNKDNKNNDDELISYIDFPALFIEVCTKLDDQYAISKFIQKNNDIARQLVAYCFTSKPVEYETLLVQNDYKSKVGILERDHHLILVPTNADTEVTNADTEVTNADTEVTDDDTEVTEDDTEVTEDEKVQYYIRLPTFFFYLYNKELGYLAAPLTRALYPNTKLGWEEWEIVAGYFTALRNNLWRTVEELDDKQITFATLENICFGAYGDPGTLNLVVPVHHLKVCFSATQFPTTNPPITKTEQGSTAELDWEKHPMMIINGKSAPFADVFTRYDNLEDPKNPIILAIQLKWSSQERPPKITIKDIAKEHKKNEDSLSGKYFLDSARNEFVKAVAAGEDATYASNIFEAKTENITKKHMPWQNYIVITLIITNRPFDTRDMAQIPKNCLLICNKNFMKYFGYMFGTRILSMNTVGGAGFVDVLSERMGLKRRSNRATILTEPNPLGKKRQKRRSDQAERDRSERWNIELDEA